jgi:hypothetical protein
LASSLEFINDLTEARKWAPLCNLPQHTVTSFQDVLCSNAGAFRAAWLQGELDAVDGDTWLRGGSNCSSHTPTSFLLLNTTVNQGSSEALPSQNPSRQMGSSSQKWMLATLPLPRGDSKSSVL